jgi:hypothetical protein
MTLDHQPPTATELEPRLPFAAPASASETDRIGRPSTLGRGGSVASQASTPVASTQTARIEHRPPGRIRVIRRIVGPPRGPVKAGSTDNDPDMERPRETHPGS